MKKIILGLIVVLVCPAATAGQKGNGGDGLALLFTEMGRRIHRESLMTVYDSSRIQMRDEVSMPEFFSAVMSTKVVSTLDKVYDVHGDEVTAVYLSPESLVAKWRQERLSEETIRSRLAEFPRGLIRFNRPRFLEELKVGWGIALKTVFHEYGRAMGLQENQYRFSADTNMTSFFQSLYEQATPVTKQVLVEYKERSAQFASKIELIDGEVARLKLSMNEDRKDLTEALAKRSGHIKAQAQAFTEYGRAVAETVEAAGVVPMPFPSYGARIMRRQTEAVGQGMLLDQKMSETAVISQQVQFLTVRLEEDSAYYRDLEKRRRELTLRVLD